MNAPLLCQRRSKIGTVALGVPPGSRQGELRHNAEDIEKVIGELFVAGIIKRLDNIVT